MVRIDRVSVLVKPSAAIRQLEEDEPERGREWTPSPDPSTIEPRPPAVLRRFYGSVAVDPQRAMRDTTTIVNEVVQHLTALADANVRVTIDIEADLPSGAPDQVVRTVTENCRNLKFKTSGFEEW